jgi:hypothetical protein
MGSSLSLSTAWSPLQYICRFSSGCKATGYDPKTLVKYLGIHGISNPWAKKEAGG